MGHIRFITHAVHWTICRAMHAPMWTNGPSMPKGNPLATASGNPTIFIAPVVISSSRGTLTKIWENGRE